MYPKTRSDSMKKKVQNREAYSRSAKRSLEIDFEATTSDGQPELNKVAKRAAKNNNKAVSLKSQKRKRFNVGINTPKITKKSKDRCRLCFENPGKSKHLVIVIANFTYLSLPLQQPVVPGHRVIITMQDNVVVFFETVMGLAREKHHCMIECVPWARDIAKQAPIYFKKAIDEAEDEWSQHNAKKLIDTSEKGLHISPFLYIHFLLEVCWFMHPLMV